jgi:heme A synthase
MSRLKILYDNAEAQAAVIYLYVVGIVVGIAAFIYTGPIMDTFTAFHNNSTQGVSPLYPISQNLQDSIFITQFGYRDWIIVYFIVLTIAAYAAALRYRNTQL